ARPQQPSERRATEIDDKIPAPGDDSGVKRQPMQGPTPLFHDSEPLQARHGFEQRASVRPRRDRQSRSWMALDQVGKETGRQHGIADARRGDKQDVHFADPSALYSRRRRLPRKRSPPTSTPPWPTPALSCSMTEESLPSRGRIGASFFRGSSRTTSTRSAPNQHATRRSSRRRANTCTISLSSQLANRSGSTGKPAACPISKGGFHFTDFERRLRSTRSPTSLWLRCSAKVRQPPSVYPASLALPAHSPRGLLSS